MPSAGSHYSSALLGSDPLGLTKLLNWRWVVFRA